MTEPVKQASTVFMLMAEFGSAEIPLALVCEKYFGLKESEAKRQAALGTLPVKAHRLAGQKSPWLISAIDLAEVIDQQRQAA